MLEKENVYNLRNRSVKRMLWPTDHEQTKRDLCNETQRVQKEFTEKYNFDFSTEKPLLGKYHWTQVGLESPISSPCIISVADQSCCSTSTYSCVYNLETSTVTHKQKQNKRSKTVETKTNITKQKRRPVCGKPVTNKSRKQSIGSRRASYWLRNSTGKFLRRNKFFIVFDSI